LLVCVARDVQLSGVVLVCCRGGAAAFGDIHFADGRRDGHSPCFLVFLALFLLLHAFEGHFVCFSPRSSLRGMGFAWALTQDLLIYLFVGDLTSDKRGRCSRTRVTLRMSTSGAASDLPRTRPAASRSCATTPPVSASDPAGPSVPSFLWNCPSGYSPAGASYTDSNPTICC
jgi:hypothetical protein